MLKKKKIIIPVIIVVTVIVVIIIFCICKKNKPGDDTVTDNDMNYESRGELAFGGYFLGNPGVLYFDKNKMLTFSDAVSGNKAYVCSNFNCEHNPKAAGSDEVECQAASLAAKTCLMDEQYIYIIGDFKEYAEINSVDIYRENMDGTNLRKLGSIKNVQQILNAYIYDDAIIFTYINTVDMTDINKPVDLDKPVEGMVYYNIITNEYKQQEAPVHDSKVSESYITDLCRSDTGDIRFGVMNVYDGNDNLYESKVCIFDWCISNNSLKEILEIPKPEGVSISPDLVAYYDQSGIYTVTSDGKSKVHIDENRTLSVLFWIEDKLYYEVYSKDEDYKCYVCDAASGKSEYIGSRDPEIRYLACSNGYIWFQYARTDSDGTYTSIEIERIKPQDYANGKFDKLEGVLLNDDL